jgi:hypothetical protein
MERAAASGRSAAAQSSPQVTPAPVVLVGAGDIASCALSGDEQTARLLDTIEGIVFTAGDNTYERGSASEFASCYGPTWGRHRERTRPAAGNHDYLTPGSAAYAAYFGAAAGPPDRAYYSYDAGTWHVVVLNSNCAYVGGCAGESPQERWLRADLAAHPARCSLAIWHHPLFSSGPHGSDPATLPFWVALYEAGAEIVIVGHDHHYERFAPQDPAGRRHDARGIREFVVGTGGASLRRVGSPIANSEVRRDDTHGVLELTLRHDGYDWRFVPVAGAHFTDQGSASCH